MLWYIDCENEFFLLVFSQDGTWHQPKHQHARTREEQRPEWRIDACGRCRRRCHPTSRGRGSGSMASTARPVAPMRPSPIPSARITNASRPSTVGAAEFELAIRGVLMRSLLASICVGPTQTAAPQWTCNPLIACLSPIVYRNASPASCTRRRVASSRSSLRMSFVMPSCMPNTAVARR